MQKLTLGTALLYAGLFILVLTFFACACFELGRQYQISQLLGENQRDTRERPGFILTTFMQTPPNKY